MKKFKLSDRYHIYRTLSRTLQLPKRSIHLAFLLKCVLLITALSSPWLFKILVDSVMLGQELAWLKWVIAGYVLIWLFDSCVQFFQTKLNLNISNTLIYRLRLKIWRKTLEQHKLQRDAGEIKNHLDQDVEASSKFIDSQIVSYLFYWILSFAFAVILCFINWKLAIFGFLMVPISFWITKWLGKGVKRTSEAYRSSWSQYESWLQTALISWKEIKALNNQKKNEIVFVRHWAGLSRLFFLRQLYWYGNRGFITIKDVFITRMNLYFIGGLLIFAGDITVGGLIVFMKYYEMLFQNINSINNADIDFSRDLPSYTRVMQAITEEKRTAHKQVIPVDKTGDLSFRNVSFKYPSNEEMLLKDINLDIRAGEVVFLIGRSGSGKSTLIHLMNGFDRPSEGEVLLHSSNICDIHPSQLKGELGFVTQEPYLFQLSIRENLTLGAPKATQEEITAACRIAEIDRFIETLPEGYDTVIGAKGAKLSGGQRQRIALARTLLLEPKVLILDEATSQLDREIEADIYRNLLEHFREKTMIVITHRLSSIPDDCRVIMLENGMIVGDGRKDALLKNNEWFMKLYHTNAS